MNILQRGFKGGQSHQHLFVLRKKPTPELLIKEKTKQNLVGVLGCFSPRSDSCSITGKRGWAPCAPSPEAESSEVGLSRALVNPLPAARLYKPPRATRRSTQGCPRGPPAWPSSAASSCPPSVPPAPSACWAPSSPSMSVGKRPRRGGEKLKSPFFCFYLTNQADKNSSGWGGGDAAARVGFPRRCRAPGGRGSSELVEW